MRPPDSGRMASLVLWSFLFILGSGAGAQQMLAHTTPAQSARAPKPLALHPDNPHYFLFRGKPTVLITSGEHYGAVLNLDFDYDRYLEELHAHGLNLTRTWSGSYREVPA